MSINVTLEEVGRLVTLEEKLILQAKNINAIYKSNITPSAKIMLLESQMDYLNALVDDIKYQILENAKGDENQ